MSKEQKIVERDGIMYELHEVRKGGEVVGLAPVKVTKDLDEDLGIMTPEAIHDLATRQRREDVKNAVRGSIGGEVTPKMLEAAFSNPELTQKAIADFQSGRSGDLANAMKNILKAQLDKPNKDTIYWNFAK